MNTFSKLQDGTWGIRTSSVVAPGAVVIVSRKDGTQSNQTVRAVIWTDGTACLCSVEPTAKPVPAAPKAAPAARRSNWRPCGYPGCNPQHCDDCEGQGGRGRSYY